MSSNSLHECLNAAEFCRQFEARTGKSVQQVIDLIIPTTADKAVFLVGSLPLGMATQGSDVDFIVLIDDGAKLAASQSNGATNTTQRLAFYNDNDPLRAGEFLSVINGVTVDVTVAIASAVKRVHDRLRSRGPQLTDNEIMTLSRLSTGWLMLQTEEFLRRNAVQAADPALDVHCSTVRFVSALGFRQKALKSVDLMDIPLALHLGRSSVEMAYLAYFASEGFSYLGAKWLAQIGRARGAAARVRRHPLLAQGVQLLFPAFTPEAEAATVYLQAVSDFLTSMRNLIEQKLMFRIAFKTCPLIQPI